MKFRSETEFGSVFVEKLRESGFETWQEVLLGRSGLGTAVADIVAKKEDLYYRFELKLSLSEKLLEQTLMHSYYFHNNYCVRPISSKHCDIRAIPDNYREAHTRWGIGIVLFDSGIEPPILANHIAQYKAVASNLRSLNSKSIDRLNQLLHEDQKLSKAGSVSGAITPFQRSCDKIRIYLSEHPEATLKDIWDNNNLHWESLASFRSVWSNKHKLPVIEELRSMRKKC